MLTLDEGPSLCLLCAQALQEGQQAGQLHPTPCVSEMPTANVRKLPAVTSAFHILKEALNSLQLQHRSLQNGHIPAWSPCLTYRSTARKDPACVERALSRTGADNAVRGYYY